MKYNVTIFSSYVYAYEYLQKRKKKVTPAFFIETATKESEEIFGKNSATQLAESDRGSYYHQEAPWIGEYDNKPSSSVGAIRSKIISRVRGIQEPDLEIED